MKSFTLKYSSEKFERVIRAKMRVFYNPNFQQRQIAIHKLIIELRQLKRMLRSNSESYRLVEKVRIIDNCIDQLKDRLGIELVFDRLAYDKYYLPKANFTYQF